MSRAKISFSVLAAVFATVAAAGCSDSPSTDGGPAQTAYLGVDAALVRAIDISLSSIEETMTTPNIPPQTLGGMAHGSLTIKGQVDQGQSVDKTIRADTAFSGFSDDGFVVYDTDPAQAPLLALDLRDLPYGTYSGTWDGVFTMSGGLQHTMTVKLTITGQVQPVGTVEITGFTRVPYSTSISGTAVSDYGTYDVGFTR
jgi:hypothetical protein